MKAPSAFAVTTFSWLSCPSQERQFRSSGPLACSLACDGGAFQTCPPPRRSLSSVVPPPRDKDAPALSQANAQFTATRWSLVLAAGRPGDDDAAAALAWLSERY